MFRRSRLGWGITASLVIASMFLVSFAPAGFIPTTQGGAPFVPGQIIVGMKNGELPASVAHSLNASKVTILGGGRAYLLDLVGDPLARAAQARALPGVSFAEPNWIRQLHVDPNDPGYPVKWDLDNGGTLCDGSDCAIADADMDWQEAYNFLGSAFNGSAIVAVIDTGIDASHPDLNDKLESGYDFLDGDSDPKDTYGHGTHVSGIAAGETNNGEGTTAVAFSPNIKIMPLRVCDQNGCPTSAIVSAIYFAADNNANVINLSLGGRFGSSSEEQAINYAWTKGLVVVASSGNDSSGRVSYPAAFANAIAVGSTNWRDQLAPYSNKGGALDVVAPGGDMSSYHDPGGIYSTMPTDPVYLTTSFGYSENYDQLQGTSMAAPQVSGLAALLFAMGGGKTNVEIRSIIESTADDLGKAGWDRSFGHGRINAHQAVLAASGGAPTPTPTPSETPTEDPTPTPTETPTPSPGGGEMHAGDLDASTTPANRGRWTVTVTITVHDESDLPLADATVSGSWSLGANGSGSCTTDGSGMCSVTKNNVKQNAASVTFTVTDIAHATNTYDEMANHDPEPDSDGTTITVSKP